MKLLIIISVVVIFTLVSIIYVVKMKVDSDAGDDDLEGDEVVEVNPYNSTSDKALMNLKINLEREIENINNAISKESMVDLETESLLGSLNRSLGQVKEVELLRLKNISP